MAAAGRAGSALVVDHEDQPRLTLWQRGLGATQRCRTCPGCRCQPLGGYVHQRPPLADAYGVTDVDGSRLTAEGYLAAYGGIERMDKASTSFDDGVSRHRQPPTAVMPITHKSQFNK